MPKISDTIGRPLSAEAAKVRAEQILTLTDPLQLRVLSLIAATGDEVHRVEPISAELDVEKMVIAHALASLHRVGLLSVSSGDTYQLTADAWVRFGRLLTAPTGSNPVPQTLEWASAHLDSVPPVVTRIIEDLTYRFSSTFSPETVHRYVTESYTLLSERAKIKNFLPSLTAKFATDRLSALATAEGLILRGTPEILFVCVQNTGRSQMAAGILRHLAGDAVHVRTAGSSPAATVNSMVVDVLDEIGVSLATEFPKPLTDEVVRAADYVITMGCGDACPIYPGRRYMDWVLKDPLGGTLEDVRILRDEITERVRALLEEMSPSPQPTTR